MTGSVTMAEGKDGRRYPSELHRRQRRKNRAMLVVLLAVVALIYVVAMVRMSGG